MRYIFPAILLLANGVSAQEPLTLEGIARAAVDNAATLGMEKSRSARAHHDSHVARAALLPRIDATAGITGWSDVDKKQIIGKRLLADRQDRFELRLEQTVFKGGESYHGYRAAKLSDAAGREALGHEKQKVLHEAGVETYSLLQAREALKHARAEVTRRRSHRSAAEKRLKAGVIASSEKLRARAAEEEAVAEEAEAERKVLELTRRLRRLTHLELNGEIVVPEPIPWPDGEIEGLSREAQASPGVRLAALSLEAAEAGVLKERGGFFPGIYAGGALRRRSESPETLAFIKEENLGFLEMRWRFFSGGARLASARSARALAAEKKEALRDAREGARLSVGVSWDRAKAAEKKIAAQGARLISSRAAYENVKKRHAAGLDSYLNLLDATTALKGAETGLRSARFAREKALLDLHFAAGSIESVLL